MNQPKIWQRRALGILAVLLLAAGAVALYQRSYPVDPDRGNLAACVEDRYLQSRAQQTMPPFTLHEDAAVTLGNRTWMLWEVGENLDLGRVILEESLTGRYRVTGLSYGGGNFREEIVEADGRQYLLFGGRNTGERIASAACTLDGTPYTLDIPAASRFLVCAEVRGETEAAHMDLESLRLYDAAGTDITEDYERTGGGI